jgi:hypothetical protein
VLRGAVAGVARERVLEPVVDVLRAHRTTREALQRHGGPPRR